MMFYGFFVQVGRWCLGGCLVFVLAACGGGNDTPSSTSTGLGSGDTAQPTAAITFPTAKSFSDGKTVTVRGNANDNVAVTSVSVNGVAATSTDEFATWFATIPVVMGSQSITVAAEDAAGNINATAASAEITGINLRLFDPTLVVHDAANDRVIVYERIFETLYLVDLATNDIQVVSNDNTPNDDLPFMSPRDMVLDALNNRIIMLDNESLISVNLNTGARSIISSNTVPDSVNPFVLSDGIVFDEDKNRVLVVSSNSSTLLSVNLTSGARTIISDASTPNANNPIGFGPALVYEEDKNRVLVADRSNGGQLLAVNLSSGERTIVSNSTTPNGDDPFMRPGEIEIDETNNRLFIIDSSLQVIFSVNIISGERSVFFDMSTLPAKFQQGTRAKDLALDTANNRLLVTGAGLNSLFSLALDTREASIVIGPDESDTGLNIERLVLDRANNRLLAGDRGNNALLAINPDSGAITTLSDDAMPNAINELEAPSGIAYDQANNRVLIVNIGSHSLMSVDLGDGTRTIISDNTRPNTNNPFGTIFGLAHDAMGNRVFVAGTLPSTLFSVDLNSGARTIISDGSITNGVGNMGLDSVALDLPNNRVFMTNYSSVDKSVVAVDLDSGVATVVTDNAISPIEPLLEFPNGLALDMANNRFFLTDGKARGSLFVVDIATGERTEISGPGVPGFANQLNSAVGIALDLENNRAYLGSFSANGVTVVDLTDGQRVILAH